MSYDDEGPHEGPDDLVRPRPPATISASPAVLDLLAVMLDALGHPHWSDMWELTVDLSYRGLFHWQDSNLITTVQMVATESRVTTKIRSVSQRAHPRLQVSTVIADDGRSRTATIAATLAPADISSLLAFLLHGTRAASVNIRTGDVPQ